MQIDIRDFNWFGAFKKYFLSKVPKEYFKIDNIDKCWPWIHGMRNQYYGRITWDKTTYQTHKISYIIFNGLIPPESIVRHTCNNPACINPKHLILGSFQDNSIDMVKSNRQGRQKLNEECVKVIKWMLKYNNYYGLTSKLAKLHNVHRSVITNIKNNVTWKWIQI